MSSPRRVRIVSGRSGLDSLRDSWQALIAASPEAPFYLLYDWYWAYLNHLEDEPARTVFMVLENASGCRGILPLRRERKQYLGIGLDLWSAPACTGMDLVGVLLRPGEPLSDWWREMGAALRAISWDWTVVKVPRIIESAAVAHAATLPRHTIFRPQGYSCYFQIKDSYEVATKEYTTRLRKILRKGWSGFGKLGTVEIHAARTAAELESAFAEFLRLEASGWKGEQGTASALAFDPPRRAFFEHIFNGPRSERQAEINLLTVDGKAVASQLCMVQGGVRSVVKIAYDQSLQKLSPGSVLLDALLKRSYQMRDVQYLSLVTGIGWMREWGTESETVGDLWLFRSHVAAIIIRHFLRLKDRRDASPDPVTSVEAT
ncbi:MAG: GNAT family N-acetyltransferase [Candidatus Competibacteraceae bacterium]|nr:GNAT family N-acetyltransferase [Candidatus Competibacteraceae bacterium]